MRLFKDNRGQDLVEWAQAFGIVFFVGTLLSPAARENMRAIFSKVLGSPVDLSVILNILLFGVLIMSMHRQQTHHRR